MFTWPFAAQALALRKSKGRTHPHGNMGLMVWGSTPRDFRFAGTVALHLDVNQSLITPKKKRGHPRSAARGNGLQATKT